MSPFPLLSGGVKPVQFRKLIWSWYRRNGRHDLPWRTTRDPYRILVSEIMLQQTQAGRVIPAYRAFTSAFPTVRALARAPLARVLRVWQGLGYNRRALHLKRLAETVIREHGGRLPADPSLLRKLPGVGPATAGAVAVFAFNARAAFLETNIRRVYLHFFFP
ncbi:A/G-specific adenine glycosylase, partial [Candidatus Parcubacteria bacterium]|nr:A/G-specific adenine glycosylase [Candidatus Parcubacteria bacterium]